MSSMGSCSYISLVSALHLSIGQKTPLDSISVIVSIADAFPDVVAHIVLSGVVIGFMCMAFTVSVFAIYHYDKLNKEKEARCINEGIDASRKIEFASMGTNSPLFRYDPDPHSVSSN